MLRWFVILGLFCVPFARADDRANPLLLSGVAEFNAAYQAWDGVRFAAAAEQLRQASAQDPKSSRCAYWLGAAHFHHVLHFQSRPTDRASKAAMEAAMDAAVKALARALELNDRDAESHAALGTLYGMKINGNWLRAARFGPRVQKHRNQALEFGAQNPRVLYLVGTCQFHTAKSAASKREALATLLAAEKLFETESLRPAEPLEPRWGYSSCLTFVGRSYESLGETASAVEYFRKALALHPADHFAREGLERVTGNK